MKEREKHQGTPVAINSTELTHPQTVCYFLPLTLTEIQMMTEEQKIISDGPSFVEDYPEEITGYAGDRVILQCQVDSNPAAEYVWMKNGDLFEVGGAACTLHSIKSSPLTELLFLD